MSIGDWHKALLALVVWREARGEVLAAKIGVACSIRNRVLADKVGPNRWAAVICERDQYSSMTYHGDPNLVEWPGEDDASWTACMVVAEQVINWQIADNTGGAVNYVNLSVDQPAWAHTMKETCKIGAQTFFKTKETT